MAACVLNNIWLLVYLGLSVIMLPILTYIRCYFQLEWLIMAELSPKELALGVTANVLELFLLHLILGILDFTFELNSANLSFAAQAFWPSLPLSRIFHFRVRCRHTHTARMHLDHLHCLSYASQTAAAPSWLLLCMEFMAIIILMQRLSIPYTGWFIPITCI